MVDLIIIGNGPAGISAALYARRANFSVVVIGRDEGALKTAHLIENYYGLAEPISGQELVEIGKQQALTLGAVLLEEEVLGLSYQGHYIVQTSGGTHEAKTVLLATGAPRSSKKLEGLSDFEGKGVSYCAICDAFFFRKKTVAVLGSGDYAAHEIADLLPHAEKIYCLTDGEAINVTLPASVTVMETPIKALQGSMKLETIQFTNGEVLPVDGVFVALGHAAASDLARKVGALIDGTRIRVDEAMQTNLPGLFAAGDCIGGVLQVATAVGDGAKAALSIIAYLRKQA